MRHTEFWARLEDALGETHAHFWASHHVLSSLGRRTPVEALEAGVPPKEVWRAVWAALELPSSVR